MYVYLWKQITNKVCTLEEEDSIPIFIFLSKPRIILFHWIWNLIRPLYKPLPFLNNHCIVYSYLSIYIYLSIYLAIYLFYTPLFKIATKLFALFNYLSVYLIIYLSICLSYYISIYLFLPFHDKNCGNFFI